MNDYEKRFEQLWSRYGFEVSRSDWSGFIDWLLSLRNGLRPASWRQYRAAVVYALNTQDVADHENLIAKLKQPKPLSDSKRHDLPKRTSSHKSKMLLSSDLTALVDYMLAHGGRWDVLALRWLTYGTRTGLRPVEWKFAQVEFGDEDDAVILHVRNAKNDAIRSHGEERHIHLRMDEDSLRDFLSFINELQSQDFEKVYEGCRFAIGRATKALWPRRKNRPTLYSARHQFAADAKSSNLLPEEVAALMGHAVTATHQQHYGKRRCGRGFLHVEADEADVARVVARMQLKSEPGESNALSWT